MITLYYATIDGVEKYIDCHSLTEARRKAQYWMGEHPEFGPYYAVSDDGVARLIADGCTLQDLFPEAKQ